MEEENLPHCHFEFDGKMLDIKSEKIKEADEAEKIKVTVFKSEGDDSITITRVFEIEDSSSIKLFIGEHVDKFFDIIKNYQDNRIRR